LAERRYGDGDTNEAILAFNRGRVSRKALARVDLQRMAFSADEQTNYPPRVLGSMSLRPGLEYLFGTPSNVAAKYIPFIFSTTDIALAEVTATGIRIVVDDVIVTRPSVSTAITNGTFDSDVSSWIDNDEAGAKSQWLTGGYCELVGTLFNAAIRRQQVSVAGADENVEHGVTFTIERGPVTIKIGSTTGNGEYIGETDLGTGTYSFAFTPTGDFHIEIASRSQAKALVDSVAVDSSGDLTLPSPWTTSGDLDLLRHDDSGDVIFIACEGYQQRKLERFISTNSKSWGISLYQPLDGPFRDINTTSIKLTPDGLSGDITVTASRNFFDANHVGALLSITSIGQQVISNVTAEDEFTDPIRVTGVADSRIFEIVRLGTWVATVTLQRSVDEIGSWTDVTTYTTNATINYDDGLDNQIIYYRIGVKSGEFTSGTVSLTLTYASGGLKGICRVTGYTSATVVSAAVLTNMGGTDASRDWSEGAWSTYRGWPSALAFYEGRLDMAGKGKFNGSISDAFDSFDEDQEGDSGPINRLIGSGPVDVVNWLLPLQRLIAGTSGAEISIRSTSFDEPLTPDNFNQKAASTEGSAKIPAIKVDANGIFVQRGGTRVYEMAFSFDDNDYSPTDLTDIIPEIGEPEIVRVDVQRQPDTRIHFVRSDGTVAMLIRELANEVLCWIDIETDGLVEDVVVLPGAVEDKVYYLVKRTVNGGTVRYLEKWALESEAVGGTLNKQADSFATFTNSPAATSVPAGTCSHLVGKTVVVWADGICLKDSADEIATFTVESDGSIAALTDEGSSYSATTGIVGLAYRARFKSTKLAYATRLGTALTQRKRVTHAGLIMCDTHAQGVKYGPDFDNMDNLPLIDNKGAEVDLDTVHSEYDEDMFEFAGTWDTDARFCLESNAPRPATILAAVVGLRETDKT